MAASTTKRRSTTNSEAHGAAERIRTSDFFLRREALYPLSYGRAPEFTLPDGAYDAWDRTFFSVLYT